MGLFARLKERIKDSREDGFLARLKEKKEHNCERCPCTWEDRSCEGDCDCGCLLYEDMDTRRAGCLLPDFILRVLADRIRDRRDEAEAKAYEGIADWYEESRKRDGLFEQALRERMFVNGSGTPVAPLRKGFDRNFYPYETQDGFALARMDYEENLERGLPPMKAFQKAVADRIETDLYYETDGGYEPVRVFANSGAARDRYHELLREQGLEP